MQQQAVDLRNTLLTHMRRIIPPFGRAFSEALKEECKTLAELIIKYMLRVLKNAAQIESMFNTLNIDFTHEGTRLHFDDLLHLLTGAAPAHALMPPAGGPVNLRQYYARQIAAAAAGLTENALQQRIQTALPNGAHAQGRDILLRLGGSREVTRPLVQASGRTNRTINRIAVALTGGTAIAAITGGVVTILYVAGEVLYK